MIYDDILVNIRWLTGRVAQARPMDCRRSWVCRRQRSVGSRQEPVGRRQLAVGKGPWMPGIRLRSIQFQTGAACISQKIIDLSRYEMFW